MRQVIHHQSRLARSWRIGLTVLLALLAPALVTPASSSAASSFYYLGFDDRLPPVGSPAFDYVGYSYSGNVYVNRHPQVQVHRGGEVIVEVEASEWEQSGQTVLVPGLAVGDVLRVSDARSGVVYAQATYRGRPAFDEGPCGPATNLLGLRSDGAEVSGAGAYSSDAGDSYSSGSSVIGASVIEGDGPGTRLEVEFDDPVKPGMVVWAEEVTSISNTVAVRSFREQRLRPCSPVKPPVAGTPPGVSAQNEAALGKPKDTRAPASIVTRPRGLSKLSLAKLLAPEVLAFDVTADEAATLDVRVTLRERRSGKLRLRDAGSISWTLAANTTTTVTVPLSREARGLARKAGRRGGARLSFAFTLTDAAGNAGAPKTIDVKLPRR